MRSFGRFAVVTGALAFLLVFLITGPMVTDSKQRLDKRGIFQSVGAGFSGKAAQERANIDSLAAFNRVVLIGGIILVMVGAGAWLAGSIE